MKKILYVVLISTTLLSHTVTLDKISIEATEITTENKTFISQEKMQERRDITMSEKLRSDVSFSLVKDAKGESAVSYRGLDYKNIKFVEDGIPLYTSNVGVDSNFMIIEGDISFRDGSSLSSTGLSSMGGEVTIFSKVPLQEFESKVLASLSTNDQFYTLYAGSMQENFYIQANANYYKRKSFELSDKFEATSIQKKGERVNSDKEQKNISLKTGYFVNDAFHLAIKGSLTRSEHGIPPNIYEDITTPTFFAYTRVDPKDLGSLYLYADYDVAEYVLSARAYYDDYKDIYEVYEAIDYVTHYPLVTYDDSRVGTTLKATREDESHQSSITFLAEQNEHQRLGGGLDDVNSKVLNLNASLSDTWFIDKDFTLEMGISYAYMHSLEASEGADLNPADDKEALDAQLKLLYEKGKSSASLSVAKKSRMPTMDEMFTYFPWNVANPFLKPEQSMQYSLGYRYRVDFKTNFSIDTYYYDIKDLIVDENSSYVNRDTALHYGVEFRLHTKMLYKQEIDLSYAYAKTEDSEGNALELVPEHKIRLENRVRFSRDVSLFFAYTFIGSRYSQNSATYTSELEKLESYNLFDAQLSYKLHTSTQLSVGVKNILDELYQSNYGYPTEGRSFYINLQVKI